MSNTFQEKYEVLRTFKEDIYQTVFIGSNKKSLDEVVVINILHKDKISNTISKAHFANGFNNLLHLDDFEEDIVVITEYKEGTPLGSYLKFFDTTVKHKINLAYEYLARAVKYDIFNNSIKKILIDESQIIFKNDKLHFNELLFLDEGFSQPTEFNEISLKLAEMIEQIVFSKEPIVDEENDKVSQKILDFISRLKSNNHGFNTIEDVYNSFRKIYIYNIFMEDEYRLDSDEITPSQVNSLPPEEASNSTYIGYNEAIKAKETSELHSTVMGSEVDEANGNGLTPLESIDEIEFTDNISEALIGNEELSDQSTKDQWTIKTRNRRKNRKKNRLIFSIAIGSIGLLILLYFVLSNIPNNNVLPVSQENSEEIRAKAYFTYEKDGDWYYIINESKAHGRNNEILETKWKILKDDRIVNEFAKDKNLKIQFESHGQYTLVLSIKDKYGNTSDYRETIIYNKLDIDELKNNIGSEEKLDNLNLDYSSENIQKDYQAMRSGSYSLKIGSGGSSNFEKISISDLDIENKPIISMWLASSLKETINISVKGYRNNTLQFTQDIAFTPKEVNAWEMLEISSATKNIDEIELVFKDFTSPIWLDDIQISWYK